MEFILYAVVKFLAYSVWGYAGMRLHEGDRSVAGSMRFGIVRWLLGVGFGVLVFFAVGSINREQILFLYLAIYIPVRFVEWTIMPAVFFSRWQHKWTSPRLYYWIIGGIVLSFLTDMVSPEMLNDARFCVGRCLC